MLISVSCISQEPWITINSDKKVFKKTIRDIHPIVNKQTGDVAIFFKTNTGLTCHLYNNKKVLISTVNITKLPKNSKITLGSTVTKNEYSLFFSNIKNTRFSALTINFKTKAVKVNENIILKLKKEKKLQFIEVNNQLHLITCFKNTSILKLYSFNINGGISNREYNLSNEDFKDNNEDTHNLDQALFGGFELPRIKTIDYDIPNALEETSAYTKLYVRDDKIIITSDVYDKQTVMVTLNTSNSNYEYRSLENKNYNKKDTAVRANSYIYGDYFFKIYSTIKKIDLTIYNLKTNELVKELNINKAQPISFKNSPIIQEGGQFDKHRELEKQTKFIRKVAYSNPALSILKNNDQFILTLGAYKEKTESGLLLLGGFTGVIGAATFLAFESYNRTKSTRIIGLFNEQFNHIKGAKIPINDFDKINTYIEKESLESKKMEYQTIFKHEKDLIWGYYNKKDKSYRLFKVI